MKDWFPQSSRTMNHVRKTASSRRLHCVYYFMWSIGGGGSVSSSISLPGASMPGPLPSTPPSEVTLPVGAEFSATGTSFSVTYNGFCDP
jgi:hypothetical protein